MKETDIKYLAGLLDADGSFFFNYTDNRVYLTIALDLSTGIDKDMKYTNWLCSELGVKPYTFVRDTSASVGIKIVVSKRTTIETLIPRILKYLVIKGLHLQRLYNKYVECRGNRFSKEEIEELKEFVKSSRLDVGSIREKSWLPKAYVAGFIDGDGCYVMKKSNGSYNVNIVSHINDRIVADLLFKQYGGRIHYQQDWIRWVHPLGKQNKSFAIKFLHDMHRHSRLKKWKIEQFLAYHSQRLTDKSSAEQVIV
jgi:hypothetical protein